MTTLFNLFAVSQYMENYGAHDWDHNGECPQYWKPKGGTWYLLATGLSVDEVTQMGGAGLHKLAMRLMRDNVEHHNHYSEEYMIDWEIREQGAGTPAEEWETVVNIWDVPKRT